MWVDPAHPLPARLMMRALARFLPFRAKRCGARRALRPRNGSRSQRQLQLTWWRFRRHRLAVVSGIVVILFYLVVIFADFLAYADPHDTDSQRSHIPPQGLHLFDDGAFRPFVYGLKQTRDLRTFKISYAPAHERKVYVTLVRGRLFVQLSRTLPDQAASARPEGPAAGGRHLPARYRSSRPRSLVADHGGDAGVADDRACGRDGQPVPRRSSRRHLRGLRRHGRHRDPAPDRGLAVDADHPALDGPCRRACRTAGASCRSISRSRSSSRCSAGPISRASCAASSSRCARRTSSWPRSLRAQASCGSSSATCCRRF